jgi:hypothetical protein
VPQELGIRDLPEVRETRIAEINDGDHEHERTYAIDRPPPCPAVGSAFYLKCESPR